MRRARTKHPRRQEQRGTEPTPEATGTEHLHSRAPAALHVRLFLDRGHERAQDRIQLQWEWAGAGAHRCRGRNNPPGEDGLGIDCFVGEEGGDT